MADAPIVLKAQLYGAAIKQITGENPVIIYHKDRADIHFTKKQARILQHMITSNKPKDVNVHLTPVVLPVIAKKMIPFFAGALIGGFILGKVIK